jgi:uncharacterized protein YcbX
MAPPSGSTTIVGKVVELARFPVKSMAGERPEAVELRWTGLHGDRQYSFHRVRDGGRFPWLTGRNLAPLVLYRAAFAERDAPRTSPVSVVAPSGEVFPLDAPALRERLSAEAEEEVRLLQSGRGVFDAMPVSVVTTAGLALVEAAHGTALDRRRFRINIVVDSAEPESAWHGARLVFGEGPDAAEILVNEGIPRCAMITIDPDSAAKDPSVLRTVAQRFDNALGVYAATAKPGRIRLGDAVRLIPA